MVSLLTLRAFWAIYLPLVECSSCSFQEIPMQKLKTFEKFREKFISKLAPARLLGMGEKWKSSNWTLDDIVGKLGNATVWPRDLRNTDAGVASRMSSQSLRDYLAADPSQLAVYETTFCPITLAMDGYYAIPKPFQKCYFSMPVFGMSRSGSGVGFHKADSQNVWGSWYLQVYGSTRWALRPATEQPETLWPWPQPEAHGKSMRQCKLERGDAIFIPAGYFRSWYGHSDTNLLFGFQGPDETISKLDDSLRAISKGDASELKRSYSSTAKSDPSLSSACVSHAMQVGHVEILKQLHSMGASFDEEEDPAGSSHLHSAAWMGQAEAIRFAIQRGARTDFRRQKDGLYPIHLAAHGGHVGALDVLLSKGSSSAWKYKEHSGKTPLHVAVTHGHTAAIRVLLKYRASWSAKDGEGFQALHWAVEADKSQSVDVLLEMRASIEDGTKEGESPLYRAAVKGHVSLARHLLDKQANVESESIAGRRAVHVAAFLGHMDLLQLLRDRGAELAPKSKNGQFSPEGLAASAGHTEIVNFLRRETLGKPSTNQKGDEEVQRNTGQSIHAALQAGHMDMLENVLKTTPGPGLHAEEFRLSAASDVIRYGHLKMVQGLTKEGKDLTSQGAFILLQSAAKHGQTKIIEWLVRNGLDVNPELGEKGGDRPLLLATSAGHVSAVRLLVDLRAEVGHINNQNVTAVHAAVMAGKGKITAALLKNGDPVGPDESSGRQHLHVAAAVGKTQVVKAILDSKADVMAKDKAGFPPHFLAAEQGHAAVLQLLSQRRADLEYTLHDPSASGNEAEARKASAFSIAAINGHIPLLKTWLERYTVEGARALIRQFAEGPQGHGEAWQRKLEKALELDKKEEGAKSWQRVMNDPEQREKMEKFSKAYQQMSPAERKILDKQMADKVEADEAKQRFEEKSRAKRVSHPVTKSEL